MSSSRIWATSCWNHAKRDSSAWTGVAYVSLLATVGIVNQPSRTQNEGLQKIQQSEESTTSSTFDGLSPTPPIYIFRPNDNLEIAFDTRTRNPVYVMERLVPVASTTSSSSSNQGKLRRPQFYEEKNLLPLEFRPRNSSYRNSGYDRGHLAAAGNYTHTSQEEFNATFNLCNCSPQNSKMNSGIWAHLERWTRKVAQENHADEADIYVVTGPLWMPSKQTGEKIFQICHDSIGVPPSLVSVPTHFFKVVVAICRKSNNITKFACFVIPNRDHDNNNNNKRQSLEDFVVPWSKLEAVSGLHFFPGLTQLSEWKERANFLTANFVNNNKSLPMLTDGSASSGSKKWSWRKKDIDLVHLCAKGRCR